MRRRAHDRAGTLPVPARLRSRGLVRACLLALAVAGVAAGCASEGREAALPDTGAAAPRATPEEREKSEADGVPAGAVAVVDGAPIPRSELDSWVDQQLLGLEAQGKAAPAEGSSEYRAIVAKTLIVLVQHKALELEAGRQGITVTRAEIDGRIGEIVEEQFGGSVERYEQSLRRSGATSAQARAEIRSQLFYEKLVKRAGEGITVSDAEIRAAYEADRDRFTERRRRKIAIILVASREDAEAAVSRLERGESFASVARTASLANAIRYTDSEGDFPPEFEKVAFGLATGAVSEPVQVGSLWYLIRAAGDLVPERTRPFREVRRQLRQQLLDDRRESGATWFTRLMKRYEEKTRYAPGFGSEPPRTG